MGDDLVKQSIAELQDLVRCRCHPAYKDRGMHDPDCDCDSADAVQVVADRIEELEAKLSKSKALLAKAMKALAQIGKTYTADKNRLIHGDLWIIETVQTTLAELKGEDRG
jgi:hypothetical protein